MSRSHKQLRQLDTHLQLALMIAKADKNVWNTEQEGLHVCKEHSAASSSMRRRPDSQKRSIFFSKRTSSR